MLLSDRHAWEYAGAVDGEFVDLLAVTLLEILAECIDEFV